MNRLFQNVLCLTIVLICSIKAHAQIDPGLEGLILLYTDNAKKS